MPPEAKPKPVDDLLDADHVVDIPDDDDVPPADMDVDVDAADADANEFKKLDSKAFYKMRKEAADAKRERDELRKKVTDYEKKPATPAPVVQTSIDPNRRREMIGGVVVPETKAEWDALGRSDWQTAVDLRAIISARKVQEESRKIDATNKSLNDAKDRVLQRHPELADATTEKGQIYLKILDKNPEYLTMPKGPILAMRDMEDEMESLGYSKEQIFEAKKVAAQAENTRVSRGALTGSGRMPEKTGRTVQLSKDDMEFCKTQGIDPVDYAKQRLELENNKRGAQL